VPERPPRSFQWNAAPPSRLAHSAIKHDLIRRYVRDYLDIVTNVPFRRELRLTLFDGFAGGGTFSEGETEVSGTPLILAEEVMAAHARRNADRSMTFDISLWIVERNKNNFDALEAQIRSRNIVALFPGRINLRHSSFEQPLQDALAELKSRKGGTGRSIFIFDQTGYSRVNLEFIRYIFESFECPEVILTFAVSWLVDLARHDPEFLKRVASLGVRETELQELLEAKEDWSPRYAGQKWVREYISRFVGAPYNTCFFLRSSESHRDLWLLHFAKQPKARDAMLEVHYAFANQAHFYGKEGFEMLGFDPTIDSSQCRLFGFTPQDASRSTDSLIADIPKSLVDKGGSGGIRAASLFQRELNDATVTFNMFREGAASARDQGLIEIYNPQGRLRPKARDIKKDDVIKSPAQTTIWHFFKS